jgi:hypothetical protein
VVLAAPPRRRSRSERPLSARLRRGRFAKAPKGGTRTAESDHASRFSARHERGRDRLPYGGGSHPTRTE